VREKNDKKKNKNRGLLGSGRRAEESRPQDEALERYYDEAQDGGYYDEAYDGQYPADYEQGYYDDYGAGYDQYAEDYERGYVDAYDDGYYDDYVDEYYDEYDEKAERKKAIRRERVRKIKIAFTVLMLILVLLGSGIVVGSYLVTYSEVNFPNLYVDGVFVGEMDRAATLAALEASGWDEKSSVPLTVNLMDCVTFDVDQVKSGTRHSMDQAASAAYAFGHGRNWFENLFNYLMCLLRPVDVNETTLIHNRDYVLAQVDAGIAQLNETLGDGSYVIDEENSVLRFIKGAGQLEFDREAMADLILTSLENDQSSISYSTITTTPKAPDFDAIFEELSAQPRDASYSDDNRFTVIPHVVGCDFDVEGAKLMWDKAGLAQEVAVPLDITYPQYTTEYLESLLYRDKLGAMTTYYPNSIDNRISNLNKAADKINGIILYPGDVFSYNETLGQRTAEAGFLPAGAYENGEVVEEVGGGICQVSSTLYAAMLYGYKLTTVERYPHYFPVDYLEKGYDATVSWPTPDFKFRNDRDFPVKIVAYYDNTARAVTVEIWGTNLDGCWIELRKDTLAYNNSKYPWIHEGWGVQVFRQVRDASGMPVDQINEIYDIYHTHEATEQIKALDAAAAQLAAMGGDPNAAIGY